MSTTTEEPTAAEHDQPPDAPPAVTVPAVPDDEERQFAAALAAAQALPAVPGRDEFLTMCQLAQVYSRSGLVPKALHGKPADCLVVMMTSRDLGIPLTAGFRKVYVIDGQPSLAPQLKISLVRKKGLGNVIPHPANRDLMDRQGAIALGPGGQVFTDAEGNVTGWTGALAAPFWFTWDDAVRGGYVRRGCTPEQHTEDCYKARTNRDVPQMNARGDANYCKDNWKKHPTRMLWQRASGFVADDHFSEATLGLYDPDELGGVLDEEGHLIDVTSVDLPEGFAPPGRGGGSTSGGGDGAGEVVSPDDSWALQLRVHALPEDAQAEFRERWKKAKMQGNIRTFPAEKANLVQSVLRGVEQQWRTRCQYDPDAAVAALTENVLAPAVAVLLGGVPGAARPEQPDAPDTAPEPDSAADGQAGTPLPEPAGETAAQPSLLAGEPEPPALDCPPEVAADADAAEEWAIEYVKARTLGQVDAELRGRRLPEKGKPDDRRARLAVAVMRQLGVDIPDHEDD